jgi:hypothetical protein
MNEGNRLSFHKFIDFSLKAIEELEEIRLGELERGFADDDVGFSVGGHLLPVAVNL